MNEKHKSLYSKIKCSKEKYFSGMPNTAHIRWIENQLQNTAGDILNLLSEYLREM